MTNPESGPIKRDDIDTARGDDSSGGEAMLACSTPSMIGHTPLPVRTAADKPARQYRAAMTTSAHTVIAAIEALHPGWSETRRHNLLFFVQGHCLVTYGTPMFAEPLRATATGAAVDLAEPAGTQETLTGRQIGILDWVLGRYEHVFPVDLQSLIQISTAWQLARQDDEHHIEHVWLTDWFSRHAERNDEGRPTGAEVDATAAALRARARG